MSDPSRHPAPTAAAPTSPARDEPEAERMAETEYRRFGALLDLLRPHDWGRPTDCSRWDVRALVAHVVGATEANASVPEMVRQLRLGRRGRAFSVDAVSDVQVRHRRHLTGEQLRQRYWQAVPRACRGRARWARLAGGLPLPVGAPVYETWRLSYLMQVIYTRDVWMHRIDLSRAIGLDPVLTPDHDARIVSRAVLDWAQRHDVPFELTLTGPAGGEVRRGSAPDLRLDAVEFCRIVSGRVPGQGLLAFTVPF